MSFDHKPYNPNRGGISRSGFVGGENTDRHPSDHRLDRYDWLVILAIFLALTCIALGITVWADVPMEAAR